MGFHALPFGGVLELTMVNGITQFPVAGSGSKGKAQSAIINQVAPGGLLSTIQAAQYLNIAPATLQVWRSTNRRILAYVKIGAQVRYRREDLDKFIADNTCNV